MYLAAVKRERHILHGRDAAIFLGRVAQFDDGNHVLLSVDSASERDTTTPSPRAATNRSPCSSTALVTPWVLPSARLCRLKRGWNVRSSFTHSPADMVGAQG